MNGFEFHWQQIREPKLMNFFAQIVDLQCRNKGGLICISSNFTVEILPS
jgi:hypothetical protein